LTLKIWQLGARVVARSDLPSAAREPIQRLSNATKETVQLAVFDDGEAVYVYKVDGTHDVRTHTDVGRRRPAHCVAAGKVMLAYMSEGTVDTACAHLEKFTKDTITNPKKLRAELQEIREVGFAVNRGEWTPMVRGLAAPVRDSRGEVIAAVNLSVPAERLPEAEIKRLAPKVIQTAESISLALGYLNQRR
jgi:DNA-binding IclR family transcriptional regulator